MTVTEHPYSSFTPARADNPYYSIETEYYSPRLTVVRATGDLDLSASADLARVLEEAESDDTAESDDAVVLLDLSAVTFMYSGAASVVIDAAARGAGRLEILAPTRPARMVFEALGAAHILTDPSDTAGMRAALQ